MQKENCNYCFDYTLCRYCSGEGCEECCESGDCLHCSEEYWQSLKNCIDELANK